MADPVRGQPYDFDIALIDSANRPYYRTNPTLATGDFRISVDEGPLANLATLPLVTPAGSVIVHVSLSALEMSGENISIVAHDVSGSEWDDLLITISAEVTTAGSSLAPASGPGAVTAEDLIKDALEKIGVLSSEQPLPPEYGASALRDLNRLLERYNIDHSMVYATSLVSKALTASDSVYTIGPGGDIDVARPTKLRSMYLRQSNIDYPLQEITEAEYAAIALKSTIVTPYPSYLWYEPSYPLGTITLYPVPSGGGTLFLNLESTFTGFATTSQSAVFPPGYTDALIYGLGRRLAPSYGRQLDDNYLQELKDALKYLKRNNRQPQIMGIDPFLLESGKRTDSTWIYHGGYR